MCPSRATPTHPLGGLLHGVPGGSVQLAAASSGVVLARLTRESGRPHSLVLPATPAVVLVLDLASPGTVGTRSTGGALTPAGEGATLVANLVRPATVPLGGCINLLVAYMPLESFARISSRWRLKSLPVPPGPVEVPHDKVAVHLCRALLNRQGLEGGTDGVFLSSMMGAFQAHFLHVYCHGTDPQGRAGPAVLEAWQLRMAEDAMLTHLDRRTPISDIAEICGVSVVHFSRAFRKATNQTPHRWLMDRRLETARHLLGTTDSTVAEIALVCGFADQSHLTRAFSAAYGTTPAAWRVRMDASITAT